MTDPAPIVPPSSATTDLLRLVRRVLTQAAVDSPLAHPGEPCTGNRARCPDQTIDNPFATLEMLGSQRIVAFCACHAGVYSPGDVLYPALRRCFG